MRIITGSAKGQTIKVPDKKIRPAQDMVRQAVFSMLHGLIEDARVLDLFAGSGSYGLEALSRGAKEAVFVDNDRKSVQAIKINLKEMGLESRGKAIKMDAMTFAKELGEEKSQALGSVLKPGFRESPSSFDLIFLSPPYRIGAQIHLLKQLAKILAPDGVIIFDHAKETEIPKEIDGLQKIRSRSYGTTGISILTHKI